MSTPERPEDWTAVEAGVRAALTEAGLAGLLREVDEAEDDLPAGEEHIAADSFAGPRDRTMELLEAAERLLAGRAALAREADRMRETLRLAAVRFVDETDDEVRVASGRDIQASVARDDQAAAALRSLMERLP